MIPWQDPSALISAGVGAHVVISGPLPSTTVNFVVQVAVLANWSETVNVTVVIPYGSDVPDKGDWVTVGASPEQSPATTNRSVKSGISFLQFSSKYKVLSETQVVITGLDALTTEIVVKQDLLFPATSVA